MLTKLGIVTNREFKRGPEVHSALSTKNAERHEKIVTCSCGKKFKKSCENAMLCEISGFDCPYCGTHFS